MYEAFVRSYADSDGDGVGDLKGLTAHLDDLNDGNSGSTRALGVDAIWLMPIFPSPSYHGYDVTDYRGINPAYGTLADFDAFLAAAHRRGIRVLLDMVLNHSSAQHPWFQDSQQGPAAAKRAYYDWKDADPHWQIDPWHLLNGSWYYAYFSPGMPDLNLGNPAVEAELTDAMKFWLARGVDGFRLDAVRYYFESPDGVIVDQPETHAFIKRIRASLQHDYPSAEIVAEVWANVEIESTYYGAGDEVQLAFAFDQASAILQSANSGSAAALINELARAESAFAGKSRQYEAPFLTNHDQARVMRALAGDALAARVAAATLFALPGTPFVYYGEELGMQGGAGGADQNKRTPYPWNATVPGQGFTTGTAWYSVPEAAGVDLETERADPGSLWNLYRRLIAVRHALPGLRGPDATRVTATGGGDGVFALLRTAGTSRTLFVANFSTAATGPFTLAVGGTPSVREQEGLVAPPSTAGGTLSVPGLVPRSFAFLSLD